MKYHLISFLFLITIISNLSSQNIKVRVSGYVTDENNQAIEFVTVLQRGTSNATTTSASGYYELMFDTKDSMVIKYSILGYETLSKTVSSNQKETQINVSLKTDSKQLGDVVIREFRKQTSTTESLEAKNVRLIPNPNGGIEGMLSTFAGVSSSNELSSQYSVRGGSYDENIVYVNDIEVYRPLLVRAGQQEGLSFINPDLVQEVSFSAGGFEAKYGDKMSSVLDIKYKKPKTFEASASVSLLGASGYIGSCNKKFTQIHGIRYKTSKYMLGTLDENGEYSPNFIDYQTYLTYQFSPKWELTFLGNFSQNKYEFTPTTRTTSFGTMSDTRSFTVYFDGKEEDLFRTSFGALTLNFKPYQNVTLGIMASAFNTDEEETYDISGEYWLSELGADGETGNTLGIGTYHEHARNKLEASVLNISHQGDWKIKSHQIKWGLGLQNEIIADKIKEWEMRDSAGYSISNDSVRYYDNQNINLYYNLSANKKLDTYRLQFFLQDTYKYHLNIGTLSAILGIRGNYWNYNEEMLFSPRFSIGFIPSWEKSYSFRFATGFYYQAPFYKELRYNVKDDEYNNNYIELNKNIKAQKTIHYVLGVDHYFKGWERPFKFTTEVYYKYASRLTPYQVDNVRIRYLSTQTSTGYTAGVDFKLFGEMVPGTDSWIGLSLMNSKEDIEGDSYVDKNTGETIYPGYVSRPTEQRYSFTMFFQDYFPNNPKYKIHLRFVWADGLPFGPPDSERYLATLRTPGYRRVDLGASRLLASGEDKMMSKSLFKYVKNIWLTAEVFNLLNIKNINSYYWVTDIYNNQYAVPNYLTSRQLNFKLMIDF